MRSIQEWFNEYAESHQNVLNQKIHYICVPAIYFSIVGILMSIDSNILQNMINFHHPIVNWASLGLIFLMLFYFKLSPRTFLQMLLFSIICLIANYYIGKNVSLLYFSLITFILAWAGQFYGHEVEGKKPSFFKDLQFLLIGPAWVFEKWSRKK